MRYIDILIESEATTEQVARPQDLSPVMSKETIDYHYGKLHKAYVDKAKKDPSDKFQKAGAHLHNIFFEQFTKPGSGTPTGICKDKLDKDAFAEEAMSIQGSGWIYLDTNGNIKTIVNHVIKPNIALLVDWWEHAWALDYQHDKAKYLKNIWRVMDWDVINARIEA